MKHNAPTPQQVKAASPDTLILLMQPPKPTYTPTKLPAAHPHGVVSGFVVARPKGVVQC